MSRSRKALLWIVVVLAVSVAAGILTAGCGKKEVKKPRKPKPRPTKTVAPGRPVTIGPFTWKLLQSAETTIIGNPKSITSSKAKGVFVVMRVQVELATDQMRTVDRREMLLVDSKGKVYTSSQDAQTALKLAKKPNLFAQETTYRGIPVEGWVAFDIPKKATGLKVKIEDIMDPKGPIGYIKLPY